MPTLYLIGHETEARLVSERLEIRTGNGDSPSSSRANPPGSSAVEGVDARVGGQPVRVPLFELERVALVGQVNISLAAVYELVRHNIPISFCSRGGRFLGSLVPPVNGNALMRLKQYDAARNDNLTLALAEALVHTKIKNSRRVLQRLAANRELSADPALLDTTNSLLALADRTPRTRTLDELRGNEGAAAGYYFAALSRFFPEAFSFKCRNRRPPRDPANALLSWTYTLLTSEIYTAICAAGLDPCLGFLHSIEYGRPSLALDLIEPFRAPVCDLLVLSVLNHGILQEGDFHPVEGGGIHLTREGQKKFFIQYEQKMERPFKGTDVAHTTLRRCVRQQVHDLVKTLQTGEGFVPFEMG